MFDYSACKLVNEKKIVPPFGNLAVGHAALPTVKVKSAPLILKKLPSLVSYKS